MDRLPLSVCMISGAEASRIGRSLESVAGWASEIIVVLNEEVRDGTDQVAQSYGAVVVREAWKGHIRQKNSVAARATQPWLFGLDADEVVPPALRAEIGALFERPGEAERFAAYSFPRCTRFGGRWIRHGDWYPDRKIRLWQRGRAAWGGVDPHDALQVEGPVGRLGSDLHHFTAEGIDDQVAKIPRYTTPFAELARAAGRHPGFFDLAFRPAWRFVRSYVFRLGFLDGWQGYYIAWWAAFYTATRYAKILEGADRVSSPPPPAAGRR